MGLNACRIGCRKIYGFPWLSTSADGERIVFTSNREVSADLFWKPLDGAASAELLYASPGHKDAGSWSPDGRLMAFAEVSPENNWDIWVFSADSTPRAWSPLQSRFAEFTPMISPDGRWLAYSSDESGRFEVSVMPFPDGGRKVKYSCHNGFGFPNYDVTPDGDRFLMVKAGPPAEESTRLNFVLSWFEELKQRMGN